MVCYSVQIPGNIISIKMGTGYPPKLLLLLKKPWQKYFPGDPFSYFFLDDSFNKQYRSDEFSAASSAFCFARHIDRLLRLSDCRLTMFAEKKGNRHSQSNGSIYPANCLCCCQKIFSAGNDSIFVAIPLTWLIMASLVTGFAYRIDISWWVFAIAGTIALALHLLH